MSLENIVVDGYTVSISANGGWTPGDWGNFVAINESFSTKAKAEGNGILKGAVLSKTAIGCSFAGHTFVTGVGVISKNADKTKAEGSDCFKEGATGDCIGSFVNNSSGATVPCSCSLEIDDAGQTKVKTE